MFYIEIQCSDSKANTIFKERQSFVSERHGENRDNLFSVINSSSKSLKMDEISVLFKSVTKLLQWSCDLVRLSFLMYLG